MIGHRFLKDRNLLGLKNLSKGSMGIKNSEASELVAGTYLGMV